MVGMDARGDDAVGLRRGVLALAKAKGTEIVIQ